MKSPAKPAALIAPDAWRSLRQEWLWVYHGDSLQTQTWSGEVLVPSGLFFVERGSVRMRHRDTEILVPEGHAYFSGPGFRRQWFQETTRLLSVGFRCLRPDGAPFWNTGLNVALPAKQIAPLYTATRRLFRTVHPEKRTLIYRNAVSPPERTLAEWAAHDAAFQSWFSVYAATLDTLEIAPEARPRSADHQLQLITQWLNSLPLCQAFSWNLRPSQLRLGPRRIEQLLQLHLGLTARAYFDQRRFAAARQTLLNADIALKEIAFSLGFRHASHFTAWFRRGTGMSPSAFRESGGGVA